MFFKGSRYQDLPETGSTDADGKRTRSKTLRWITDTPGDFLHTVNQADRLDLLAYQYYDDDHKWWLICDANPDFSFPTDLLDLNPIVQEIFFLLPPEGHNKWSLLIKELKKLRGLRDVQADVFQAAIFVTYNQKELLHEEIKKAVVSQGFAIENILKNERPGQEITVPPDQVI
ncbi:MAG: hypothetical protein GTO45_32770 [Candidatus Aminicenantes bacterium]|nr:hypothetical protein [Candidatus Aminicenantes bacterium]NIM80770.1 hypothetical protein [Candidatus Aminicenantes bacterium]NIN17621.1 hypothetical protein [Candidatus Aminicenantes bacterium]NIN48019.1 hypothetical protein [Candidatus Aminicenantes bacterium]NIN89556.1 hypothetical protein [Candidatus Aminicenantes bacterium]